MSQQASRVSRRSFFKASLAVAGAASVAPMIIPSSALGLDGAVAPSERVVVGGIGIGNRGTYDLGCFLEQPDVQFVAVCDVKEKRRVAVKQIADTKYGNENCSMHSDFREVLDRKDIDAVLIATGAELALYDGDECRPRGQGHVLREAGHEEHLAEPDPG